MDETYGYYEMTVAGPEALVNSLGAYTCTVKGFNRDDMDRRNLEFNACERVAKVLGLASYDDMPEQYTPVEFGEPELTANGFRNVDGTQQFFVAAYLAGRGYGGPEEGGWWYDTGELVQQTAARNLAEAKAIAAQLADEFPHTGKRYSVLGGEDYDIRIGLEPFAADYPDAIPHYE